MSDAKRLLVICADPDGPVVRYRILQFLHAFADAGVLLEVVPWPAGWFARRAVLRRAEEIGAAWVVSRLLRRSDVANLRKRVRRLLFDFDDALSIHDSTRGSTPSAVRERRFLAIVRAADAVSAGNAYLAGFAERAGVTAAVLPSVVRVDDGPPAPEPSAPPLVLGWIGSSATLPYLQSKTHALAAVVAMGVPFRLRVVADAFPVFPPGIAVEGVPWSREAEGPALDGIHVGVAPLPDDAWTRGKCGLKVIQMMARGRPVVASAVGVQREQVQHGVTGFLAEDDTQFVEGVVALARDPDLRRRMGKAAREEARAHWSVDAWAGRVVDHVTNALA